MRNGSKIWSFFIRCAYRWIREAHYFQINITFRQGSSSATLPSLFFLVLSSGNTPCVCLSWNPIFRSLLQWLKPETRASHKGKLHKARPGTPKIRETSSLGGCEKPFDLQTPPDSTTEAARTNRPRKRQEVQENEVFRFTAQQLKGHAQAWNVFTRRPQEKDVDGFIQHWRFQQIHESPS